MLAQDEKQYGQGSEQMARDQKNMARDQKHMARDQKNMARDQKNMATLVVLGRSWRVLASLSAVLVLPGGPREHPGGSGEWLGEVNLFVFFMVQRKKVNERSNNDGFTIC